MRGGRGAKRGGTSLEMRECIPGKIGIFILQIVHFGPFYSVMFPSWESFIAANGDQLR